jgi:hypothetical protein
MGFTREEFHPAYALPFLHSCLTEWWFNSVTLDQAISATVQGHDRLGAHSDIIYMSTLNVHANVLPVGLKVGAGAIEYRFFWNRLGFYGGKRMVCATCQIQMTSKNTMVRVSYLAERVKLTMFKARNILGDRVYTWNCEVCKAANHVPVRAGLKHEAQMRPALWGRELIHVPQIADGGYKRAIRDHVS